MADNVIDDKTIQRALFICSDILAANNAVNTGSYDKNMRYDEHGKFIDESKYNRIYKLKAGIGNQQVNGEQSAIAIRRQQELFGESAVPSEQSAYEIFRDNYTKIPLDTSYTISNNLVIYISNSPFYFNIDKVNYDNKKFYISKLNIKNKSKDTFTLKSNYALTLKIHFTTFDDLLEKNIVVNSVLNPKYTTKVSLIEILYPFYNVEAPIMYKEAPSYTGILLNQTLEFHKHSSLYTGRYKDFVDTLGIDVLSKNFHLTYHKHQFDMFKNEEPIYKYFENELTIEFVAYEADGVDRPVDKSIPKVNSNLYKALDKGHELYSGNKYNKSFLKLIIEKIQEENKKIELLSKQLNCPDNSTVFLNQSKESKQEDINATVEQISTLKKSANRKLIQLILDMCKIYRIDVPINIFHQYEVNNFKEAFSEAFSWSTLAADVGQGLITQGTAAGISAASAGTAVVSAVAGVALPAAVVSAAVYTSVIAIRAAMSKKTIIAKLNSDEIRSAFTNAINSNKYTIKPAGSFMDISRGVDWNNPTVIPYTDLSAEQLAWISQGKGEKEANEKFYRDVAQIIRPDKDALKDAEGSGQTLEAPIYFIKFSDIMRILLLLDNSNSLKIISGGYNVDLDPVNGYSVMCNFADLPITLNSFSRFLYSMIEETDRSFQYDTELFFKDCYENLVKSVIADGQVALPSIKNATPKSIKISSTIHIEKQNKDSIFIPSWLNDVNLLDDNSFNQFKNEFIKSKNFNLADNKSGIGIDSKLAKYYVLGTTNEIKYYDFYKNYREYVSSKEVSKASKRNLMNSDSFQEFINRKHMMPCLLMKNLSDSESILKKKYVSFSRIDNPNLNTGQFLNGAGLLRFPYQFRADFKVFMSFFMDLGSFMFIAPPSVRLETKDNLFGFGGLYMIKSAELDYSFQRLQDGKLTFPNLESKFSMEGYMVSHGDSIIHHQADEQAKTDPSTQSLCVPIIVNKEPAFKDVNAIGAKGLIQS